MLKILNTFCESLSPSYKQFELKIDKRMHSGIGGRYLIFINSIKLLKQKIAAFS